MQEKSTRSDKIADFSADTIVFAFLTFFFGVFNDYAFVQRLLMCLLFGVLAALVLALVQFLIKFHTRIRDFITDAIMFSALKYGGRFKDMDFTHRLFMSVLVGFAIAFILALIKPRLKLWRANRKKKKAAQNTVADLY